ncbi:hypothetical protein V8D89_013288 [Ganoderma adspersum]
MDAALLASLETTFHELNATRYMSAAGLMILFYDHLLTFGDEVQYIWSAPSTYAKYIFLLNRYTVLGILIAVAYEMCGFVGTAFTDVFIFTCSLVAIVSVGIANLLTLQRVVILWDHRPIILKIMAGGFVISFTAQVMCMVYTLVTLLPSISWSSPAGMCVLAKSSPILIAVWACPMIFELFVLGSTALNALDRPRTMELHIHKALQEDGIQFFVVRVLPNSLPALLADSAPRSLPPSLPRNEHEQFISTFRVLNIIFAALNRPSLTFLAVFFIWAMTTTILGRLLLHLRRTECRPPPGARDPASDEYGFAMGYDPVRISPSTADTDAYTAEWDRRRERAISPFGLIPLAKRMSGGSAHSSDADLPVGARMGMGMGMGLHGRMASLGTAADGYDDVIHIAPPTYYHYRKRAHDPNLRPWD